MEFNYLVGHTLTDGAWKDDHSGASAEKSPPKSPTRPTSSA